MVCIVTDNIVPVFVPGDDGKPNLVVGQGRLSEGRIEISLKDSAPAMALERMMNRGEILGLSFIHIPKTGEGNG